MSKRALNQLSLGLLLAACLPVGARVVEYALAVPGLTIALPEYVESALDPGMELDDQGRPAPQLEAWAVMKLREKR